MSYEPSMQGAMDGLVGDKAGIEAFSDSPNPTGLRHPDNEKVKMSLCSLSYGLHISKETFEKVVCPEALCKNCNNLDFRVLVKPRHQL